MSVLERESECVGETSQDLLAGCVCIPTMERERERELNK